MAYLLTGTASRSHVGHGLNGAPEYTADLTLVTARIAPLVGLGIFISEVLMLVAKGPMMVVQALKSLIARQRVHAELTALDDRLLADIGIDRGQIDRVAAGLVRRGAAVPATAKVAINGVANENSPRHLAA
ncbi:DUF1127 domain-containing protein [Oleomonas cavernae]|nr:DUF1127 domain-containing protein [Oleomonas cavernae]